MRALPFPADVTRVAFAGDWHSDASFACRSLAALAGRVEVVVHTGDFGYRFTPEFLFAVDQAAQEAALVVMFVDGNHEDFSWLYAQPVDADGVRRLTSRVWHLPRGFRWAWAGLRFLALGGAHSVDSPARSPWLSWWPQETITLAEAHRACLGGPVDVLVAHDCPSGVDIPGLTGGELLFGSDQIAQAEAHRALLGQVTAEVRPRYLWHGHYHRRYVADAVLEGGPCRVTGLGDNTGTLADSLDVVTLTDLG